MIIKRWTSGSVVQTFNTTSGSPTLSVGSTSSIKQGANISGSGIPANTVVSAITSDTTLTMSANATATATGVSLTFTGGYVKDFPQTQAQLIRNNADTENIFDSNDKIKPNYLPNSVFDTLYFYETTALSTGGTTLRSRVTPAIYNADFITNGVGSTSPRSVIGYYWVVTTGGRLDANSTAAVTTALTSSVSITSGSNVVTRSGGDGTRSFRVGMTLDGAGIPAGTTITAITSATQFTISANATATTTPSINFQYNIITRIRGGEERDITYTAGNYMSNINLEAGDWFVIHEFSGGGTTADPFIVTVSHVNNTYELMTGATASVDGAAGLVPSPLVANRLQFLRGDGTWATPTDTNTTYTISTLNGDDIYSEKIRLASSASVNDDVAIAVGATQLTQRLGTLQSNTTVLVTNTSGLLVGQLVTGTGIPANTLITNIVADTSITISNAATSSGNQTLTFSTFGLTIENASDVITVKHADTSSAADLGVSARRYVTGLSFDTFGHVIGYSTATETVVDTNTASAVDNILNGSNSGTAITYAPYSTAANGKLSSVVPTTGTTILGYSGHFYANQLFDAGNRVLTSQNSSKNIVGGTGSTVDEAKTNGNVAIRHFENTTPTSTHSITGAGATTVTSDASGNITITSTDNNTTYSAGNGISLSTTTFSVAAGVGLTQEASGLKMTQPFISSATVPAASYQVVDNLWFDIA